MSFFDFLPQSNLGWVQSVCAENIDAFGHGQPCPENTALFTMCVFDAVLSPLSSALAYPTLFFLFLFFFPFSLFLLKKIRTSFAYSISCLFIVSSATFYSYLQGNPFVFLSKSAFSLLPANVRV